MKNSFDGLMSRLERTKEKNSKLENKSIRIIHVKTEKRKKSVGKKEHPRDFPGVPVVKTPCFHCRGHEFDP